jgi:hypothetical protein
MQKHLQQHKSPDASLPAIKDGLTKKQVAELAEQSVEHVLEKGNVFQVAEAMAAMEEFVKCIRKDERFVEFLRDELQKHHGKLFTTSGAKIENCEAGVSYDYSNNAEWKQLDEQIKMLTEEKKSIEEKLRKIGEGKLVVDEETGEVFEAPLKKSKSTYRITLKAK